MSAAAQWDVLHRDPRHRLAYPSEHVVRWLARFDDTPHTATALDIGCGAGRHLTLMEKFGYIAVGCDIADGRYDGSTQITRADMADLPYPGDSFAVALAYGVFYYGTREDHHRAVDEMRRVLRPGGQGFVCIRTDRDWRQRFTYSGVFHCHGEPEDGMPMHFLTEYEVSTMYGAFTRVSVELTETTTRGRNRCDSDWLIAVQK